MSVIRMTAASAVAIAIAAPAAAQQIAIAETRPLSDATAPETDPGEGSEIVVTGSIVEAQRSSIAQKRIADNLVDIAAADAVGRFPDQNSAAALARLPAVAVRSAVRLGSPCCKGHKS